MGVDNGVGCHAVSGARGRGEPLSKETKIITSDLVLELGEANETIRWYRVKVDQKDPDERRNSRTSWRHSHTGAGTEVSISRNGTTTLGESPSGPRVDCAHHGVTERTNVQQGKQYEDEYSIHSRINAYTISSCRGVRV